MGHRRGFLYALVGIALILQACGSNSGAPTATQSATEGAPIVTQPPATDSTVTAAPAAEFFSPIPLRSGIGFRASWLELYFTDPASPLAQREVGGVDALVAASISGAKESVDVALRNLNLDSITKLLIAAHRRGLAVRVVTDTDSLTARSDFQLLTDEGIPVVDDQQPGLMNNRFIIIDHNQVWTGSLSYDNTGVFRENNSLVRIFSEEIASNYAKEFDEMFVNRQFGTLVVPETPKPSVTIDGTQVEVLFSPDDIIGGRLIQLLNEAQESIYFLAYSFAFTDLGNVIRERAAQGIKVGGVLEFDLVDPNLASPNPNLVEELNLFKQAGLDIRLDGVPEVMNDKIMIIDGKIVVMGSYDFTNRAETDNDENVLIFHSEVIAQKFMEEFQRIQARAQQ